MPLRPYAALVLTLALAACGRDNAESTALTATPPAAPAPTATPPTPPETPVAAAPQAPLPATDLDAILAGDWRDPANVARDIWRHPKETLGFFGVTPDQRVLEISPGRGWYTEILVPLLRERGHYVGAVSDPAAAPDERMRDYFTKSNADLRAKLAARADVYGTVELRQIDGARPDFGPAGSIDTVLTFRNVHNWLMAGQAQAMFKGFYAVLKPGGVLGVVEHRAAGDVPPGDKSGYVGQEQVIGLAQAAGFAFEASSEINANPADTKDHEAGVWSLPPSLRLGDKDREKYLAIGESDRMTLRFRKPAAPAAP
ncbi:MAG: class I SAM-dependent methyltransferase [Immundisolibacter sp.]|uniref:class I SAM-dependent methyltransferase n=1 Tax=Immundisolibacter sp. TaxID=1934948 RepID=UPI003D148F03